MQCLLIDKNAEQRLRIAGILNSLGVNCESSNAFTVGFGSRSREQPHLILLEASSADLAQNFLEDLQHAHKFSRTPKIICYANAPPVEEMAACILAGATDYLVQPFDKDLLRFKLRQAGLLQY